MGCADLNSEMLTTMSYPSVVLPREPQAGGVWTECARQPKFADTMWGWHTSLVRRAGRARQEGRLDDVRHAGR